MSKKTDRAAKLAGTSPTPLPAQQHFAELKFAEGSSFQSLPCEEQTRMIDFLHAYREELPRLLSEGEAGRFAVIKGHEVAHVWDTADDAIQAATLLIGPEQFAVYQVKPQDVDRLAWSENSKESPCPQ